MAQVSSGDRAFARDVRAYNHLAEILVNRQQFDEAIKVYRAALAIKPNFVQAHNGLGQALVRKGRLAEATHQFRQAIRSAPDFARAQHRPGRQSSRRSTTMTRRRPSSQKAVAADPKDLRALKCLAWLRDQPGGLAARRRPGGRAGPAGQRPLRGQAARGARGAGGGLRRSGPLRRRPVHRQAGRRIGRAASKTNRWPMRCGLSSPATARAWPFGTSSTRNSHQA